MLENNESQYSEAYLAYQRDRSPIRKWVRQFYIRHAVRHLIAPIIDLGCGIGEHLAHFDAGSIGIEVNKSSVDYCVNNRLNVIHYDPENDGYELSFLEPGKFRSMLISHVLEHLDQPDIVIRKLLNSCERLGIQRVFICVPGRKGYAHDSTHRTFIDQSYIDEHNLSDLGSYKLTKLGYFPLNASFVGNYFTHNEMYIIYDRV